MAGYAAVLSLLLILLGVAPAPSWAVISQSDFVWVDLFPDHLQLSWNLTGNGTIILALLGHQKGRMAVGFGTSMNNADALLVPFVGDQPKARDGYIQMTGVTPTPDEALGGTPDITVLHQEASSTHTFVVVERNLSATDVYDHTISLTSLENIIFMWTDSTASGHHGLKNRASATVNFAAKPTPAAVVVSGLANLRYYQMHGATMVFVWFVVAPLGLIAVRYLKNRQFWLELHGSTMSLAVSITAPLAWATLSSGTIIYTTHTYFGILLMIAVCVQFVLGHANRFLMHEHAGTGFVRPAFRFAHRLFGAAIIVLSMTNCFYGLKLLEPTYQMYLTLWLSFVAAVLVYLETRRLVGLGGRDAVRDWLRRHPWIATCLCQTQRGASPYRVRTVQADLELNLTPAEVEKHAKTSARVLMTFGPDIFDCTSLVDVHPGGGQLLRRYAGKDVARVMAGENSHRHSLQAYEMLDMCWVGTVVSADDDERVKGGGAARDGTHKTDRGSDESGGSRSYRMRKGSVGAVLAAQHQHQHEHQNAAAAILRQQSSVRSILRANTGDANLKTLAEVPMPVTLGGVDDHDDGSRTAAGDIELGELDSRGPPALSSESLVRFSVIGAELVAGALGSQPTFEVTVAFEAAHPWSFDWAQLRRGDSPFLTAHVRVRSGACSGGGQQQNPSQQPRGASSTLVTGATRKRATVFAGASDRSYTLVAAAQMVAPLSSAAGGLGQQGAPPWTSSRLLVLFVRRYLQGRLSRQLTAVYDDPTVRTSVEVVATEMVTFAEILGSRGSVDSVLVVAQGTAVLPFVDLADRIAGGLCPWGIQNMWLIASFRTEADILFRRWFEERAAKEGGRIRCTWCLASSSRMRSDGDAAIVSAAPEPEPELPSGVPHAETSQLWGVDVRGRFDGEIFREAHATLASAGRPDGGPSRSIRVLTSGSSNFCDSVRQLCWSNGISTVHEI